MLTSATACSRTHTRKPMKSKRNGPIAVVFGTRPEAIKLAPVILRLRVVGASTLVVTTGQHQDLVASALGMFGITPDLDLQLMKHGQDLDYILSSALTGTGRILDERGPSAVVVQGDTTSSLAASLAAFHRSIPVAHVEAGLRSHDLQLPHPEELNRRAISIMARWHFCPTADAQQNLHAEGIETGVHLTGNTVVDAIRHIIASHPTLTPGLERFTAAGPYILATAHRRESWALGIKNIAQALLEVLDSLTDHRLVFVVHPNPAAREPVMTALGGHPRARIVGALEYGAFLTLLRGSLVAVTDSGGVQEEGPTLGVPVIITRSVTERPEGVLAGAAKLVGTNRAAVRDAVLHLARDTPSRRAMASAGASLYGDGHSAERVVDILLRDLS